jgi:hypothetical protein
MMMKTKLNASFKAMSGRLGKLVYCCDKDGNVCWVREYSYPEITEHNHEIGDIGKNLGKYKKAVSTPYLTDLKDYIDRYRHSPNCTSGYINYASMLTKMMYALKKAGYPVDLYTVTPQVVVDNAFPVRTVKEAIENGLIPMVKRYDDLVNWIVE